MIHSNINSLKLLVGEEKLRQNPKILEDTAASFIPQTLKLEEPPEIYDEKKRVFINYDEKYKAKFDAAENMTSNLEFCTVRNSILLISGKRKEFGAREQLT